MKKTFVKCPQCGTNIAIVENAQNIAPDVAVNLHVTINRDKSAEAKIEALKNAGVNVSNLFSIYGVDGSTQVARMTDGRLTIVADDDPIFVAIMTGEHIPDRRLFRRWVMGQMFHMLTVKSYGSDEPMGFTKALKRKGYDYQWKMVVEEMRVQARLYHNDKENYIERNRWFDKVVVSSMADDYSQQLKDYIEKSPKRKCKGVPYIKFRNQDIFVADLKKKVFNPIEKGKAAIAFAETPEELYRATKAFYQLIKDICPGRWMRQSKWFQDAYKGAGAFFTLKNLILFHDCVFPDMTKMQSLNHLMKLVDNPLYKGWQLLGVLKEFLEQNNVDILAKQKEWRAK